MTYIYTIKHDNSEHPFNEFKLTVISNCPGHYKCALINTVFRQYKVLTLSWVERGRYGMWLHKLVSKDICSFLDNVSEWGWLKPRLWKKRANRQLSSLWLLKFMNASITEPYNTRIKRSKSLITMETLNLDNLLKKKKPVLK